MPPITPAQVDFAKVVDKIAHLSPKWERFKTNEEAIAHLKTLPRFKNSTFRTAFSRARVFLSLLYCRLFNVDKPVFIVLVVNNHCDINCTYCYGHYGERTGQKYRDYSTVRLLTIIDELWSMGTRLLTVHGGEAMLRRDIGEILNYCKLKGFYISFNTNGYHVPERIEELKCLDTLVVSLDGREENNDKHRGAGNFRTALNAVHAGVSHAIPTVISATLTRDNMNDMHYLADLAQDLGVRVQYSILYKPDDDKVRSFEMTEQETRDTTLKILDLRHRGYPVYYSDNVLNTTAHWPAKLDKHFGRFAKEPRENRLVPCYHGRRKYQIDGDGRVVECWATDYPDAPNINEVPLKDAIARVHAGKTCYYCPLLANNEHNAFMHMSPRNLRNILFIQVMDSLKRAHGWFRRRSASTHDRADQPSRV